MQMLKDIFRKSISQSIIIRIKVQESCLNLAQISGSSELIRKMLQKTFSRNNFFCKCMYFKISLSL